jgi:hypothetical protein
MADRFRHSTVSRAVWPAFVGLLALLLRLPAVEAVRQVPLAAAPVQEHRIYLPALGQSDAPVQLFLPFFASPTQPGSLQAPATVSMQRQPGFVQRVGENLQLDGQPYSFVGTNVSYLAGPFFPEADVEEIVSFLASKGVQVIRVWVEPWCDLGRVARLLDLAGKHNVRLILTLQNMFGYEDGYWFRYKVETTDLPHIRSIVTLFASRPEVLMWELMNEPTCPAKDSGQDCWDALYRWAQVTSQEIKRLDPNHLVSVGMQSAGFDDRARETFRRVHALDTVDIISVHANAGTIPQQEIDIAHDLGKPIYLGEVWMLGRDEHCNLLPGGILDRRAQIIAGDIAQDRQVGLDGYLLWQYNPEDGCGVTDYRPSDPVWEVIKAAGR